MCPVRSGTRDLCIRGLHTDLAIFSHLFQFLYLYPYCLWGRTHNLHSGASFSETMYYVCVWSVVTTKIGLCELRHPCMAQRLWARDSHCHWGLAVFTTVRLSILSVKTWFRSMSEFCIRYTLILILSSIHIHTLHLRVVFPFPTTNLYKFWSHSCAPQFLPLLRFYHPRMGTILPTLQ